MLRSVVVAGVQGREEGGRGSRRFSVGAALRRRHGPMFSRQGSALTPAVSDVLGSSTPRTLRYFQ